MKDILTENGLLDENNLVNLESLFSAFGDIIQTEDNDLEEDDGGDSDEQDSSKL